MTKEKMAKLIAHYAKVREDFEVKNPRPEQTDEEKQLAQEGLLSVMDEMKPLRSNANKLLL